MSNEYRVLPAHGPGRVLIAGPHRAVPVTVDDRDTAWAEYLTPPELQALVAYMQQRIAEADALDAAEAAQQRVGAN